MPAWDVGAVSGLLELAERCEAATEGGFDLNKEILKALGYTWRGMGYWFHDDSHQWLGCTQFTLSIDAALTLVPEGLWHEIKGPRRYLNIPSPVPNYWSAHLSAFDHTGDRMGWGATPALAICAAALRALTYAPVRKEKV